MGTARMGLRVAWLSSAAGRAQPSCLLLPAFAWPCRHTIAGGLPGPRIRTRGIFSPLFAPPPIQWRSMFTRRHRRTCLRLGWAGTAAIPRQITVAAPLRALTSSWTTSRWVWAPGPVAHTRPPPRPRQPPSPRAPHQLPPHLPTPLHPPLPGRLWVRTPSGSALSAPRAPTSLAWPATTATGRLTTTRSTLPSAARSSCRRSSNPLSSRISG